MSEPKYKRVLLKLSGEVLAGEQKTGVNAEIVGKICDKIKEVFSEKRYKWVKKKKVPKGDKIWVWQWLH